MDAFIGEIRAFPYGYVPRGWLLCNGQQLAVGYCQALYSVVGNTWGGTANKTFNLPNLQTLTVIGAGTGPGLSPRNWSKQYGEAAVAVNNPSAIGSHTHTLTMENPTQANVQADTLGTPVANSSWLARAGVITSASKFNAVPAYTAPAAGVTFDASLHPYTVAPTGGGGPHENRQPYLTFHYCICNDGAYPIRN